MYHNSITLNTLRLIVIEMYSKEIEDEDAGNMSARVE